MGKKRFGFKGMLRSELLLFLATTGCTTFTERYYVGTFDPGTPQTTAATTAATTQPSIVGADKPGPTQFYRYTITGNSVLSDTKFEAGLYSASAVDQLFGEVKTNSASGAPSLLSQMPETGIPGLYCDHEFLLPATLAATQPAANGNPPAAGASSPASQPAPTITASAAPPATSQSTGQSGAQPAAGASTANSAAANSTAAPPPPSAPAEVIDISDADVSATLAPPNISLLGVTNIQASIGTVTAVVDNTTTPVQIKSIQSISLAGIRSATVTQTDNSGPPIQLVQASIAGDITYKGNLSFLLVGGSLKIVGTGFKSQDGAFTEAAVTFATTDSPYDSISWVGGSSTVHGGSFQPITSDDGAAQVTGALVNVMGATSFMASKGAQLNVFGGNAKITAAQLSLSTDAGAATSGTIVPGTVTLNDGTTPLTKELINGFKDAKPVTGTAGAFTFLLSNPSLSTTGTSTLTVTQKDSTSALVVPSPLFHAKLVEISSGTFHLNTQQAVNAAVSQGKTVELGMNSGTDKNRHVLVRFGPEGTAIAQKDSERMVVFMSSNPNAFVDQIDATIATQQTKAKVAAIAMQPQQAQQAQTSQDIIMAAAAADSFLSAISSSTSSNLAAPTKQFMDSLDSGN